MTAAPRDSDRSAVYAAEDQVRRLLDRSADFPVIELAGSHLTLPPERHFGDLASVQRYVDEVTARSWVRSRWPGQAARHVTVRERRGTSHSHYEYESATIAVPVRGRDARWALRETVILHELAHHLDSPEAGHGPSFVRGLLALVEGMIGHEVAFALHVMLSDQGVSSA